MPGDSSSFCYSRFLNGNFFRNLCVGQLVVVAFILLIWTYSDRSRVPETRCALGEAQELPRAPTVNVVVQMPTGENKTLTSNKNDPTRGPKWNYNWDKKAWPNKDDANGVPMRTIILVRHGQYDLNTGHLTEKGRQQANWTGARLKQLNMAYNGIIHSTLDRAVETAQLIHPHLPHLSMTADEMIMEGGPVPPEPTIGYWGLPDRSYFVDGPRLEAAFRKYFYRADKTQKTETIDILVGHGNIFRYFLLRALQFPAEGWMRLFIPHASISLVHINPDGTVSVTKLGDSGHFPPDYITI